MTCSELESQIADYLAREADAGTTAQVERHLAECAACRGTAALWDRLGDLPVEAAAPSTGFPSRFRQQLASRRGGNHMRWFAIAAAVLVGILGFAAGRSTVKTAEPSGDLAGLRREVRNLREVVALSLLNQQSASERLRGIRYSAALEGADTEVVEALSRTLRSDPSINVRLAAADALRRYPMPAPIRDSVWGLLEQDESPLVQIAVIDLMASSKDPTVRERLEKLKNRPGLDGNVSEYLQAVLSTQGDRGNTYQ